jgi:hypothetical protein
LAGINGAVGDLGIALTAVGICPSPGIDILFSLLEEEGGAEWWALSAGTSALSLVALYMRYFCKAEDVRSARESVGTYLIMAVIVHNVGAV